MGVSFYCGEDARCYSDKSAHTRCSTWQELRFMWTKAAILYMTDISNKQYPKEDTDHLVGKEGIEAQEAYERKLKREQVEDALAFFKAAANDNDEKIRSLHLDKARREGKIYDLQDTLTIYGIFGWIPFVDHSDCDGSYTVGQCIDMVSASETLAPYLKKINGFEDKYSSDSYSLSDTNNDIMRVFRCAALTKEYVRVC